jgi:nucleotide-binding universal stress UspA family protein
MVFADDASQSADVAWLWVNSHAWDEWEIDVVSAVPPGDAIGPELDRWEADQPRQWLGRGDGGQSVTHYRAGGEARKVLAQCTDRDLLVLGPKGQGFLKTLHLGSTAEALMHDPPMPLVIARHGKTTRRVVVCSDGSAHCHAAVTTLLGLPWVSDLEVLVATVPQRDMDAEATVEKTADLIAPMVKSVNTAILRPDEMQPFYHPRGLILSVLPEWETDLLVLGSRGLSGFSAIRAGSIAASLAAHAPCSVLLAKAA